MKVDLQAALSNSKLAVVKSEYSTKLNRQLRKLTPAQRAQVREELEKHKSEIASGEVFPVIQMGKPEDLCGVTAEDTHIYGEK